MTTNQTLLHQKLKTQYCQDIEGKEEVPVKIEEKNYRLDILDEKNGIVYEVQRSYLGPKFYNKVKALLTHYRVIVVHPIPIKQKVTRIEGDEVVNISYTKKYADFYSLFRNLVSFKLQFVPGRLGFDIILLDEHIWKESIGIPKFGKRRRYRVTERDIWNIHSILQLRKFSDFVDFLPKDLPKLFTNKDVSKRLDIIGGERRKKRIAGCMTYSLCNLGILSRSGKKGRAYQFRVTSELTTHAASY